MAEISNTTLAILVFATLVVVVAGTVFTFNRGSSSGGLTGRATSDTGNVTLTIAGSLAIQVDTGNKTVAFGTCTPRGGSSYTCASNDAVACDGTAGNNCTGDNTTPQYIRVQNVGNVNASVNVTSLCTAATLIGGTSPALQFQTTECNATNVTSWTTLDTTTALACNRTVVSTGAFRLYVNVTIPQDAVGNTGACTNAQTVLTFSAIQVS